jgi:O-antigen/teichoic acid export membrane protein
VALGNLRGAALRGLHNFIRGLIPELVIRPGVFVLLLTFAALAYGTVLTAQSAMALHVAAAAVAFLGGIFLLNQVMPSPCRKSIPVTKSKVWVASAVPLALAEGMRHLQGHVGALTLGWFATSADVGLFRVAESAAGLTWLPSTILLGVIMPSIASLFASGDQRRLQKLVVYTTAGMFLGALGIALILLICGRYLLATVFGADFADANNAMLVLTFGQLLNSAIGPTVVLLNMTGQERAVSQAFMYSFALNVLISIALVPLLGTMGAALASAISFFAWNIILWRHSSNALKIETSLFGLVKFTSP